MASYGQAFKDRAVARFDAVLATAAIDENAKGAWCRANGVYLKDRLAWRQSAAQALAAAKEAMWRARSLAEIRGASPREECPSQAMLPCLPQSRRIRRAKLSVDHGHFIRSDCTWLGQPNRGRRPGRA